MNVQSIVGSKLAAAEASYNSAFGVIKKIQKTAEDAAKAARVEKDKAEVKKIKAEVKMRDMETKRSFYQKRAAKIAAFIADLG